jgi:hypothetical protein
MDFDSNVPLQLTDVIRYLTRVDMQPYIFRLSAYLQSEFPPLPLAVVHILRSPDFTLPLKHAAILVLHRNHAGMD